MVVQVYPSTRNPAGILSYQTLGQRLPHGVNVQREGQYVAKKRSDIRAGYSDFNIPVEAKKNTHRDLWRAPQDQLILQVHYRPGYRWIRNLSGFLVWGRMHYITPLGA